MLFAGDTAGRISCWDVTALLLNHIKERCDLTSEEGELVTKVSRSEYRKDIDVAKLTTQDENPGNKASEKRLCGENVSSITCDAGPESAPSCHAQENLTTVYSNKVKCLKSGAVDCDPDCKVSNVEINTEVQRTERTENEFQLHSEERILRKATDGEEHTAVACEKPIQSSVNEHQDNETYSTLCEEQSNFSCLPLVRIFLDPPIHVFQAHQSGVNAASLTKTQGKTTQLLFSEWIPLNFLICRAMLLCRDHIDLNICHQSQGIIPQILWNLAWEPHAPISSLVPDFPFKDCARSYDRSTQIIQTVLQSQDKSTCVSFKESFYSGIGKLRSSVH